MNEFIRQLPKIELHDHLDGGLRTQTVFELLQEKKNNFKIKSLEELSQYIEGNISKGSLADYLKNFELTTAVMQSYNNLKRIAYESAEDLHNENVVYAEIRFAPELHTREGLTLQEVINAVREGLIQAEEKLQIKTNIIICLIREASQEEAKEIAQLCIDNFGDKVCGFDIAGKENGNPPEKYIQIFRMLKSNNIPVTIHAGEESDYSYINAAILDCKAKRIGHGIKSANVPDKLCLDIIKQHEIHLEVCISSNIQTKVVESVELHPAKILKKKGINFSLCSDNRLMSKTNISQELKIASKELKFSKKDLVQMQKLAIKNSFATDEIKKEILEKIENFEKINRPQ
ncbi:MAG: adenosine deaminase [Spirochaetales bacterium]|nr:adenosine deaminase [Spirochaetales bacterium]